MRTRKNKWRKDGTWRSFDVVDPSGHGLLGGGRDDGRPDDAQRQVVARVAQPLLRHRFRARVHVRAVGRQQNPATADAIRRHRHHLGRHLTRAFVRGVCGAIRNPSAHRRHRPTSPMGKTERRPTSITRVVSACRSRPARPISINQSDPKPEENEFEKKKYPPSRMRSQISFPFVTGNAIYRCEPQLNTGRAVVGNAMAAHLSMSC